MTYHFYPQIQIFYLKKKERKEKPIFCVFFIGWYFNEEET